MRLIDWALEPENQRLGPQNGEVSIPSHSKSVIDPDVPKFEEANLINYDFAKYGTPAVRDGLIKRWTEQVFPLAEIDDVNWSTGRCGRGRAHGSRPFLIDQLTQPTTRPEFA